MMSVLQGFWELDLSSWDISAGSLLVSEAGGRVTDTRGEAYTLKTRDIFASNGAPEVHDSALAALAAVNAIRPDAKLT
jgi:myo-inositol-1(or 4)-monophosphatase